MAFDLADRYRNPVMILGDGVLGQTMEPVTLPDAVEPSRDLAWTTTGAGPRRIVTSIYLEPEALEVHNLRLQEKYHRAQGEARWEAYRIADAALAVVAYGIAARVARTAVDRARDKGIPVGLLRPITLFPFPVQPFREVPQMKVFLATELSAGQMVEDVRLAVDGRVPVRFYGRLGGMMLTPPEVLAQIEKVAAEVERQ